MQREKKTDAYGVFLQMCPCGISNKRSRLMLSQIVLLLILFPIQRIDKRVDFASVLKEQSTSTYYDL